MGANHSWQKSESTMSGISIFKHTVKSLKGEEVALSSLKGAQAYLLVNVARKWGKTKTNYKELQVLHEKYSPKLCIIAFPCNNFGGQEPGSNSDVEKWIHETAKATFTVMGKIECDNNSSTHPLYAELMASTGGGTLGWNFAKFLCDKDGAPIERFTSGVNPSAIEPKIQELLK